MTVDGVETVYLDPSVIVEHSLSKLIAISPLHSKVGINSIS